MRSHGNRFLQYEPGSCQWNAATAFPKSCRRTRLSRINCCISSGKPNGLGLVLETVIKGILARVNLGTLQHLRFLLRLISDCRIGMWKGSVIGVTLSL